MFARRLIRDKLFICFMLCAIGTDINGYCSFDQFNHLLSSMVNYIYLLSNTFYEGLQFIGSCENKWVQRNLYNKNSNWIRKFIIIWWSI